MVTLLLNVANKFNRKILKYFNKKQSRIIRLFFISTKMINVFPLSKNKNPRQHLTTLIRSQPTMSAQVPWREWRIFLCNARHPRGQFARTAN